MNISKEMKQYAKRLGYSTFKSHQKKAIESICAGKDTFVVAAPGFGKNGIIFAAALSREERSVLVIEPTLSLIYDQVRRLSSLEEPIAAAALTSYNRDEHDEILKKFKKHQISILYATPERLPKKYFQKAMEENEPWLVVADEYHLVLDWGETFRPDYLKIGEFVNNLSHRPTILAMTATAPPADRKAIQNSLDMTAPEEIILSVDKPNLYVIVENRSDYVLGSKKAHLEHLLKRIRKNIEKYAANESVIVYAITPDNVTIIANYLEPFFPGQIVMSHGKLAKESRANNERLFLTDESRIIVATSAFGQGVDKANIRLVVHFGLPLSVVDYWQQIGRAGRDGDKAHAVVIYDKGLMKQNEALIKSAPENTQKQMKKRQKELETIITGDSCIMQGLLRVLGEERGCCNHCSVCQRRKTK